MLRPGKGWGANATRGERRGRKIAVVTSTRPFSRLGKVHGLGVFRKGFVGVKAANYIAWVKFNPFSGVCAKTAWGGHGGLRRSVWGLSANIGETAA